MKNIHVWSYILVILIAFWAYMLHLLFALKA